MPIRLIRTDNGVVCKIVNIPDEVYEAAARIAEEQHVTVEDFIAACTGGPTGCPQLDRPPGSAIQRT